ncbi:hypothetical protein ABPG72_009939 [Tetrahymena utriculariae]
MQKIAVKSQFNNNIHNIKYQKESRYFRRKISKFERKQIKLSKTLKKSEKKKRRQNYLHKMMVIYTGQQKRKDAIQIRKIRKKDPKINFSQIFYQLYKVNPQYAKLKKLNICFLRILQNNCQTCLIPDSNIEIQSIIKNFYFQLIFTDSNPFQQKIFVLNKLRRLKIQYDNKNLEQGIQIQRKEFTASPKKDRIVKKDISICISQRENQDLKNLNKQLWHYNTRKTIIQSIFSQQMSESSLLITSKDYVIAVKLFYTVTQNGRKIEPKKLSFEEFQKY